MWLIESSPLGRIVVPPEVPSGFGVFCTTRDDPGRIDPDPLTGILRDRFGVNATLTTCRQIHSATVVRAERRPEWRECDSCDALFSEEKQTALGIKIADCLPVAIVDAASGVIANVHSGWRGAVQGITSRALDAIRFDPQSTIAYLGPSIRACCFEVGEEVAEQFAPAFVNRSHVKPHVDLIAFTTEILRAHGIAEISDSGMCTRCDDSIFHSYRKDGPGGGRNLMIVGQ